MLIKFLNMNAYGPSSSIFINPKHVKLVTPSSRQHGVCYIKLDTGEELEIGCSADDAVKRINDSLGDETHE